MTKGAFYFRFPAKALLADAVMDHQTVAMRVPDADSPLQTVVDITYAYAQWLKNDVALHGAVRLSVDAATSPTPDLRAFTEPIELLTDQLTKAHEAGQLLATVDPEQTAELITGCFTGTQVLSHALCRRQDLQQRLTQLWNHNPARRCPTRRRGDSAAIAGPLARSRSREGSRWRSLPGDAHRSDMARTTLVGQCGTLGEGQTIVRSPCHAGGRAPLTP